MQLTGWQIAAWQLKEIQLSVLINDAVRTGRSVTVKTLMGDDVELAYSIADIADITISNHLDGSINPDYPQELQPRNRTSLESRLQVNRIAMDLDPENLAQSDSSATGAPIVGPDLVVESGNGRMLGIWRAYVGEQADDYRSWLVAKADDYGIDAGDVDTMDSPVLVRVRLTEIDRAQFARDSNTPSQVPDKESMLERAMSDDVISAKVQKGKRREAGELLASCSNIHMVVSLFSALDAKKHGDLSSDSYKVAQALNNAIYTLSKTTPDNSGALKMYQVLVKKLIGSKISDSYEGMTHGAQSDFTEVLGLNKFLKASAWAMWFSKGEIWQTGELVNSFFELHEGDEGRIDIARDILAIWRKYAGTKSFDFAFLAALKKLAPRFLPGGRAAALYNLIARTAVLKKESSLSQTDAAEHMAKSTIAGRQTLESIQVIKTATDAKEALRTSARDLAVMLKGALSQQQISNVLRYSPAVTAMANYDPDKDSVFGARYSPMSSFIRSMEYRSTQAALEILADIDPVTATKLNDFYEHYKSSANVINNAIKEHVNGVIDQSSVTDEIADAWLKGITINNTAIKVFDAKYGKDSIQNELKRIYKLSGGTITTLRSIIFKANARAYARLSTGEVMLSASDDLSVLWHEVGHHFEFSNPERLTKAKAYLSKRMGQEERYMVIEGTKDELAISDSLSETYIGRVYGDKTLNGTDSTEVFSMAFQCIQNVNYCGNSIMNNDELLDFFLGEIAKEHQ